MSDLKNVDLEWPSKRIPPGGVLHNHKVEYSVKTQEFLKVLMDEAKFTLAQRRETNFRLRSGSSLSDIVKQNRFITNEMRCKTSQIPRPRPRTSRRRSLSAILTSDAFQIERYRPKQRNEDRDVMKKKLQDIMEFGKNLPPPVSPKIFVRKEKALPSKKELLNDLLIQIKERKDWLQDMEELGEGPKHRELIADQIAERIRKIEALKLTDDDINDEDENNTNINSGISGKSLTINEKNTKNHGLNRKSNSTRAAEKIINKSTIPRTA